MSSREQPWMQPFNQQGSSDRQAFISSEPFQSHQRVLPSSSTHALPSPSHPYSPPYQGPEVPRRLYSDGYYPQPTGQPTAPSYQQPAALPTQEYGAAREQIDRLGGVEPAIPSYYTTTSQDPTPLSPVTPSSVSYSDPASNYPVNTDFAHQHPSIRSYHSYEPSPAPPPYANRPGFVPESRGSRLSNYEASTLYSTSSYYHGTDAHYIPPPMAQVSRRGSSGYPSGHSSSAGDWFSQTSTGDSMRQEPPIAYKTESQLQAPPRPSTAVSYFQPPSPNRSSGDSEPPHYNHHDGSRSSEEIEDQIQDGPASTATSTPQKPKRRRADAAQLRVLNEVYARTAFPSTEERGSLSRRLGMTPRQVQIWFQNRRQNAKAGRGPPMPGSSQASLSPEVPTPYPFVKDESYEPEEAFHRPFYSAVPGSLKREYD